MRRTSSAAVAPPSANTFGHSAPPQHRSGDLHDVIRTSRRATDRIAHRRQADGQNHPRIAVSNAGNDPLARSLPGAAAENSAPHINSCGSENTGVLRRRAAATNLRADSVDVPQTKNSRPGAVVRQNFSVDRSTVRQFSAASSAPKNSAPPAGNMPASRHAGPLPHVRRSRRLADDDACRPAASRSPLASANGKFSGSFSSRSTCGARRGNSGSRANSVL